MDFKMQRVFLTLLTFSTIGASWLTKRECDEVITGPVGVFQFTDPYEELQSWTLYCEYNITVDGENRISLTISSMSINSSVNSIDCGDSYIKLKDGLSRFSKPLGQDKYCGDEEVGPLITTGNQLNIHTVIELGLGAHYIMKYQREPLPCGGIFELTPGNLTREIQMENSGISECIWIFIAPTNYALSMIPTKCDNVSVESRNGGTDVSPLIPRSCSNENNETITTNNLLYVKIRPNDGKFHTFSFNAHITAIEATCGGTLRVDNGVIISPNYPFNSPNKVCTWKIRAPSKKRIQFEFQDLHLSDSVDCERRNYLRISERMLENDTHNILGTFCGSAKPNIIKTSCNKATIEFRSDYHNIGNFRGFVLNFTTSDEPCVVNCGGILTSDNGVITSPNFPDDYQSNLHCEWKIDLLSGKRIEFRLIRVLIDHSPSCSEDYIQILENVDGRLNSLGTFCNDSDTVPISTSGSVAGVLFHSNDKKEDSGFLLTYSAIEESPCNIECGGVITRSEGKIESPPQIFGTTRDCEWTIEVPFDNTLQLGWEMNLRGYSDYVSLKEKDQFDVYTEVRRFTSSTMNQREDWYQSTVKIFYHSEGYDAMSHFIVNYQLFRN